MNKTKNKEFLNIFPNQDETVTFIRIGQVEVQNAASQMIDLDCTSESARQPINSDIVLMMNREHHVCDIAMNKAIDENEINKFCF